MKYEVTKREMVTREAILVGIKSLFLKLKELETVQVRFELPGFGGGRRAVHLLTSVEKKQITAAIITFGKIPKPKINTITGASANIGIVFKNRITGK